ncbi:MAG: DNA repair protein RecO [Magnetococcales bacterium]|nr:DNA repair protein RecO [Magnetococcales bacterium]
MRRSDQALVLRRTPFRDSSLIVHFLTRHHGRMSGLARGVRSSKRADRAALAGFHTVTLFFNLRSHSQDLATLGQIEVHQSRPRMSTGNPILNSGGQVVLETLYRALWPRDPQPVLFDLASQTLDGLEAGEEPMATLAVYLGRLVHLLGYGWNLDSCIGCGTTYHLDYFSIRRLHAVCGLCGSPYAHRLYPLKKNLKNLMQTLAWPIESGLACSPKELLLMFQLGAACYAFHTDGEIAAARVFLEHTGFAHS